MLLVTSPTTRLVFRAAPTYITEAEVKFIGQLPGSCVLFNSTVIFTTPCTKEARLIMDLKEAVSLLYLGRYDGDIE